MTDETQQYGHRMLYGLAQKTPGQLRHTTHDSLCNAVVGVADTCLYKPVGR